MGTFCLLACLVLTLALWDNWYAQFTDKTVEVQKGPEIRQPSQEYMTNKWRSWDLNLSFPYSKDLVTAFCQFSSFPLRFSYQPSILILMRTALLPTLQSVNCPGWQPHALCHSAFPPWTKQDSVIFLEPPSGNFPSYKHQHLQGVHMYHLFPRGLLPQKNGESKEWDCIDPWPCRGTAKVFKLLTHYTI